MIGRNIGIVVLRRDLHGERRGRRERRERRGDRRGQREGIGAGHRVGAGNDALPEPGGDGAGRLAVARPVNEVALGEGHIDATGRGRRGRARRHIARGDGGAGRRRIDGEPIDLRVGVFLVLPAAVELLRVEDQRVARLHHIRPGVDHVEGDRLALRHQVQIGRRGLGQRDARRQERLVIKLIEAVRRDLDPPGGFWRWGRGGMHFRYRCATQHQRQPQRADQHSPTSNLQYPASSIQLPVTSFQLPTSNIHSHLHTSLLSIRNHIRLAQVLLGVLLRLHFLPRVLAAQDQPRQADCEQEIERLG